MQVIAPLPCCCDGAAADALPTPVVAGEYIAEGYAWQGAVNAGEPSAVKVIAFAGGSFVVYQIWRDGFSPTACWDWIQVQRDEFKRLGIIGDWENPYTTMTFEAEARIV